MTLRLPGLIPRFLLAVILGVLSGCSGKAGTVSDADQLTAQRDAWVRAALESVEKTLSTNPPGTGDPEKRRQALYLLDDPLHLEQAPRIGEIGAYFRRAVDRALHEIETERVTAGATVWKLYNHSFVVKTSEAVFAFDIFSGVDEVCMSYEQIARLAKAVDAMFISHYHKDHADYRVADLLVAEKKKVFVPGDLWADKPISGELVRTSWDPEVKVPGLEWIALKGHQGEDIHNNVHLISSGGVSVMHTGDQSNEEDFGAWIDSLGASRHVDILLPNCWTTDMPRLVRGINPRVVITGHENELGHTVDHRESFSKTYGIIEAVDCPCVVMSWGERYRFEPKE